MKKKRTQRPEAAKQPRTTLAKRIRAESDMDGKLVIAEGSDSFGGMAIWRGPECIEGARIWPLHQLNDEELFGLVENIRNPSPPTDISDSRSACYHVCYDLGAAACAAILRCDHKFFSRIAAILQFQRKPKPQKYYRDILYFCAGYACGTEEDPCDPWKLLSYLEANGHRFTHAYENQLPRTLHAVCKKLGVHLLNKKAGRPRKNAQR